MGGSCIEGGAAGGPGDAARGATLEVVTGPDAGRSVPVAGARVVVGRDPSCALRLTDEELAPRQLLLRPGPSGVVLETLAPEPAVSVSGVRVLACTLEGEATIRVGRTGLRLRSAGDVAGDEPPARLGALLGRSAAMRQVLVLLERVAAKDVTVLIAGESGTGKELAARALHEASARAAGPFVVVDCGAIAPALVESELFGHERGAFTGADRARLGAFEAAAGGTLLLDEVGELPLDLQPKLLRVLEAAELKPVGATEPRRTDVRVVAATNRCLADEVAAGRFREDLYFRLAVVTVELPPLRERPEDVPLLLRHFAERAGARGRPIDPCTMAHLLRHGWPGNVRELRNVVERLAVLPELGPAAILGLPATRAATPDPEALSLLSMPYHEARALWAERFEKAYLGARLEAAGGVVAHAAEAAGIPRQTFHRLLRKHGLRTGHTPVPTEAPPRRASEVGPPDEEASPPPAEELH